MVVDVEVVFEAGLEAGGEVVVLVDVMVSDWRPKLYYRSSQLCF